jgi:hypothetical protein
MKLNDLIGPVKLIVNCRIELPKAVSYQEELTPGMFSS